jgi:hypothetical protein
VSANCVSSATSAIHMPQETRARAFSLSLSVCVCARKPLCLCRRKKERRERTHGAVLRNVWRFSGVGAVLQGQQLICRVRKTMFAMRHGGELQGRGREGGEGGKEGRVDVMTVRLLFLLHSVSLLHSLCLSLSVVHCLIHTLSLHRGKAKRPLSLSLSFYQPFFSPSRPHCSPLSSKQRFRGREICTVDLRLKRRTREGQEEAGREERLKDHNTSSTFIHTHALSLFHLHTHTHTLSLSP